MTFARKWLEAQTLQGYDLAGNRLECRATTRKGTPCQRMPLPHNGYCPSHQHLADGDVLADEARRRPGRGLAVSLRRHARRLHRAGDHGFAPGREPRPRRPRAPRLQPHPRDRRVVGARSTAPRSPTRRRAAADGADAVITMVVDGAQVEEMLLGEDGAAAGAPDGTLFIDCTTIAPADARRIGTTLTDRGPRLRRRARDRLRAQGRGRHADDHVRRQRRRHGARDAAARGDGREDRPRRRGRPGPGGQGHLQLGQRRSTAPRSPRRWWSAAAPTSTSRPCSRSWAPARPTRRCCSSRASRCSSTTSRHCSSSSTCSRTSACASTRRARTARPFPFAALARELYSAGVGRGLGEQDFAAVLEVVEGLADTRV